ncbi:hypothetical protein IEE83_07310 [Dyadobacter sp. UP-52]|uniref:Lipoprotein n=2 Tax=Dyadobacter subterraneus TaxID=2773304 RepID=A0ABR9W9T0_9BACT|nr:hypothetical protein [Dyadobacter subterraneus]
MKTYCYILFFSCAIMLMFACNSGPTQHSAVNMKTSDKDSTFNICYSSVVKKDTVLLNALMFGDSVKGSLGYKLYEKDHSNGSLLGKMYGDTLKATCTFMVKGSESIQEVIFLKKDSLFVEGLANRKTENGKIVFADSEKLHFDGIILKQVPCK